MNEALPHSVLTGMGVVIDDHVHTDNVDTDPIADLLAQIEEAGIPFLPYESLPTLEACRHFSNVAFILLDWELWKKPAEELRLNGVTIGTEVARQGVQDNIAFLKGLRDFCFAPVFIFSYLEPEEIKQVLRREGLLGPHEERDFILVRKKSDLKTNANSPGRPLLDAVEAWVDRNPSIYVLCRWKDAVSRSQNRLFWDLYAKDPGWPSVLWETYRGEGDDPEHSLADILLRNMRARLFPLSLAPERVAPAGGKISDRDTTKAVLQASMIVPHEQLPEKQYGCGDIFKGSKQHYWINIRCDCDCIPHEGADPAAVTLYLLEARPMRDKEFLESFEKEKLGLIQKNSSHHVLFPVDGKALRVRFGELCQVRVGDIEERKIARVGRLTPPYITQIRQRFALHLQREGLPRIPNAAIPPEDAAA